MFTALGCLQRSENGNRNAAEVHGISSHLAELLPASRKVLQVRFRFPFPAFSVTQFSLSR